MGLEQQDVRKLGALRKRFPAGRSAMILGDCHLHFGRAFLAELFPDRGLGASNDPATLGDLARAFGFDRIDTVDLFGQPTVRFDLHSESVPVELAGRYDWVLDAGTAYCCFNVAAVL